MPFQLLLNSSHCGIALSDQTPDHLHPKPHPAIGAGHDFKGDGDDGACKDRGLGEGLAVGFNGADMGLYERLGLGF
ncbi:MAG: hypothetical protein AB2L24_22775 [Mangrovibacterium sp.]